MLVVPFWMHSHFIVTFTPVGQGQNATDSFVFFFYQSFNLFLLYFCYFPLSERDICVEPNYLTFQECWMY